MHQSNLAGATPCGDVTPVQNIAESLKYYTEEARFVRRNSHGLCRVPKTDLDYMDAMCAVAKCTSPNVVQLLSAHAGKRKNPKQPDARYAFGAALEAYALYVQKNVVKVGMAEAVRQSVPFVRDCLLRAERNMLIGFARDPHHLQALAFSKAHPSAACWTLNGVATRMAMASLHQPRLAPTVFPPHVPLNVAVPATMPVSAPAPVPVGVPTTVSVSAPAAVCVSAPAAVCVSAPATIPAPASATMHLQGAEAGKSASFVQQMAGACAALGPLPQERSAARAALMLPPAPRPPAAKRPRKHEAQSAAIASGTADSLLFRISDGTPCDISTGAADGLSGSAACGLANGTPSGISNRTEQDFTLGLDDGFLAFLDGSLSC